MSETIADCQQIRNVGFQNGEPKEMPLWPYSIPAPVERKWKVQMCQQLCRFKLLTTSCSQ